MEISVYSFFSEKVERRAKSGKIRMVDTYDMHTCKNGACNDKIAQCQAVTILCYNLQALQGEGGGGIKNTGVE